MPFLSVDQYRLLIGRGDKPLETAEEYFARIKVLLPHFPAEVVQQWFYDHWQEIEKFAWMNYPQLTFKEDRWSLKDIPFATLRGDAASEVNAKFFRGDRNGSPRMARLAAHIRSHGTWPVAPIFLANPNGRHHYPGGYPCAVPYHLIEGHHRVAVLSVLKDELPVASVHRVWIAKT